MTPEPGLYVNVCFRKARDGDTVEVTLPHSAITWAIRLIGVWAPELHTGEMRQQAAAARSFLAEYLMAADPDEILLFVPFPLGDNWLKFLTFDRIPGTISVGGVCVNDLLVAKGYASSRKGGQLGR